jgi:hypothetical protein
MQLHIPVFLEYCGKVKHREEVIEKFVDFEAKELVPPSFLITQLPLHLTSSERSATVHP